MQEKTVIVAGGATGTGRATCRMLAQEGARVAVTDVQDDAGKALVANRTDTGADTRYWHLVSLHPIGHVAEQIPEPLDLPVAGLQQRLWLQFLTSAAVVGGAGWLVGGIRHRVGASHRYVGDPGRGIGSSYPQERHLDPNRRRISAKAKRRPRA
jgi:hypothetical protein